MYSRDLENSKKAKQRKNNVTFLRCCANWIPRQHDVVVLPEMNKKGSMPFHLQVQRVRAGSFVMPTDSHCYLPTPPLPPTKTHCRLCWSMMFFSDGSGRSSSLLVVALAMVVCGVLATACCVVVWLGWVVGSAHD
jgi:hypothetical protein